MIIKDIVVCSYVVFLILQPLPETVALVKDIAAEYVTDLVSLFCLVVCESGRTLLILVFPDLSRRFVGFLDPPFLTFAELSSTA